MPYAVNDELPFAVRRHLPLHAQDVYREAFNHAWEQHGGDDRCADRVARGAVKRLYVKRRDSWELNALYEVV